MRPKILYLLKTLMRYLVNYYRLSNINNQIFFIDIKGVLQIKNEIQWSLNMKKTKIKNYK